MNVDVTWKLTEYENSLYSYYNYIWYVLSNTKNFYTTK